MSTSYMKVHSLALILVLAQTNRAFHFRDERTNLCVTDAEADRDFDLQLIQLAREPNRLKCLDRSIRRHSAFDACFASVIERSVPFIALLHTERAKSLA